MTQNAILVNSPLGATPAVSISEPLRVVTLNVNGVRAAFRKGMADWLAEARPHILALQEVRAADADLAELFGEVQASSPSGQWHILHDPASAKGRAGVAIVSAWPAVASRTALGPDEFDSAGRWLEADFVFAAAKGTQSVTVVSTYVHSGEVDTPKQVEKYKFLHAMQTRMAELIGAQTAASTDGNLAVVLGDLNVGHTELDIKNWKGNLKNAGFLPEERAFFDIFMNQQGWRDLGRDAHPDAAGPYTWWSFRGQAFDTDAGWRIDYQLATPSLAERAGGYAVHRAASYDTRFTDHSPVQVEYSL
jgi:exodeoxyribonuclease-3